MSAPTGFRPAFLFHLGSGVRVVLSLGPLQLVVLIIALGFLPQPLAFLRAAARGVVDGSAHPWAGAVLALFAVATTSFTARRVLPGARGWAGHLPVSAAGARRALLLAFLCAQAVPAVLWLGLCAGGVWLGTPARVPFPLAFAPVLLAAAYTALPYVRRWPRVPAGAALVLGATGDWPALVGACLCLAVVETLGGPLETRERGRERTAAEGRRPEWTTARISWNALGWSTAAALGRAALPVGAAMLMLRNNPDATAPEIGVIVRAGCGTGAALIVLSLAGGLVTRRPPWSWSRSLPWSSRSRVGHDAAFLALHTLPFAAAAAGLDLVPSSGAVLVLGMYLAIRAAGAMRRSAGSLTGLGWRFFAESAGAVILVAAQPWVAAVLLVLLPAALFRAAHRERSLKVSLLRERQYLPSGDPTW